MQDNYRIAGNRKPVLKGTVYRFNTKTSANIQLKSAWTTGEGNLLTNLEVLVER